MSRVLAEFKQAGGGVLSIAPHHAVQQFHEQFSAFFNLVMLAGTGAFTILGDHLAPRGLLGQFMLIERTAYQRVGGHEAVKGRILEWIKANRGTTMHVSFADSTADQTMTAAPPSIPAHSMARTLA